MHINLTDTDAERARDAGKKTGESAQAYIRQAALNRLNGIDAAAQVRIELATAIDQQRGMLGKVVEELFELVVAMRNEMEQQNSEHITAIDAALGIDRRPANSQPPKPASAAGGGTQLTDIFK